MKALFLAGGKGIRLKPLTDKVPKPMIPIMNKPLLERTMVQLKKSGISEIVISSCYRSQYIEEYFGNGERFGLKIQYIVEDLPLGTGGAIKKAEAQFKDTFIVFNSDILSDIDMKKMLDYHRNSNASATIAVTEVSDPSSYGVVDYDADGYAVSFIEKPVKGQTSSSLINAGIYILEPGVLREIAKSRIVSIERDVFPSLIAKGHKIAVYKYGGYWMDIGTVEKYMRAHKDITDQKCKLVDCDFPSSNVRLGMNVKINPEAQITGPTYIGDDVEICAGAVVRQSVIGNNVSIGSGSSVVGSILWNDIKIGSEVRLINTIVTSSCDIRRKLNYSNTVYSHQFKQRISV